MTKYRSILIFGPPGSGKGTQGKALGTLPGFFHCSCGDVFRSIGEHTELGASFLAYSTRGQLVPDEITIGLWKAHIRNCIQTHIYKPETDWLVLDGIPRNSNQARFMDDVLKIEHVFHLAGVSEEVIALRLKKRALRDNRLDDANDDVVRHRLTVFQTESLALLGFYSPSLIRRIDAMRPPHVVLLDILLSLTDSNGENIIS